mmetsp:Transcript_13283/g.32484  ORF Transcript_13283/g.32484 Transcript_13283/m.32484 type:complete len:290 (+) Transcript_13283:4578-5447(+)
MPRDRDQTVGTLDPVPASRGAEQGKRKSTPTQLRRPGQQIQIRNTTEVPGHFFHQAHFWLRGPARRSSAGDLVLPQASGRSGHHLRKHRLPPGQPRANTALAHGSLHRPAFGRGAHAYVQHGGAEGADPVHHVPAERREHLLKLALAARGDDRLPKWHFPRVLLLPERSDPTAEHDREHRRDVPAADDDKARRRKGRRHGDKRHPQGQPVHRDARRKGLRVPAGRTGRPTDTGPKDRSGGPVQDGAHAGDSGPELVGPAAAVRREAHPPGSCPGFRRGRRREDFRHRPV